MALTLYKHYVFSRNRGPEVLGSAKIPLCAIKHKPYTVTVTVPTAPVAVFPATYALYGTDTYTVPLT